MSGSRFRSLAALLAAAAVPFLGALALVPFRTALSGTNAALVLVAVVVAVVVAAAPASRAAGTVAPLSAAVWFDFFLTRPYQRFTIGSTADVETAALLLVTGLIVGAVTSRARRLQKDVDGEAADVSRLYGTMRMVEDHTDPGTVVEHVRQQLTGLLDLRDCRFEYGPASGALPCLDHDGNVWQGLSAEAREATFWPDAWPESETELPVIGAGERQGRFLLDARPGPLPPVRARLVAVALAAQAGSALRPAGRPGTVQAR